MLDVRSISRHYGDLKAVDNVTFSIEPGEIVGLLGHNGAGKTTIMKLLSGYLEPDSGSILLNNQRIHLGDKTLQRSLGYLPENLPVYPELSVASYLQYAAELKGLTGKTQRQAIRRVIESTDLSDRFLSPINTLSRGMKQRVGVAQALLGSPSLLILDEPTNGLDPAQTEQMRQLIKSISESATVILSTHIMQEVEAMCTRALIVQQGQLAVDTPLNDINAIHRIALSTTADQPTIMDALCKEDWFESLTPANTHTAFENANAFSIETKTDIDINEAIDKCAIRLVNQTIPIISIQGDKQDLQQRFLQMTAHRPLQDSVVQNDLNQKPVEEASNAA